MSGPFIFYHKIADAPKDARIRGGYTPAKRFAKQMAYLAKEGFSFLTASEMVGHFREHGSFPARSVAVTFDDGWKDNYVNAFPVMRRFNVKATIFLIPSCIGQTSDKALSEGELAREHLSLEDIREMSERGVEFGSHTLNHKLLHRIPADEIRIELEESKRQLEALLDRPCKTLAYPGGHFNEDARRIAEEVGYEAAFTTFYGDEAEPNLYALNRTEILRRDRFIFQFARKLKELDYYDAQARREP